MMIPIRRILFTLAGAGTLVAGPSATSLSATSLSAAASSAAPLDLSSAEAREALEFARGLAADFSLVALAEEVLDNAEKAGVPSSMADEMAIAKANVFAIGARGENDPTKRHAMLDQALDAYRKFSTENSRSAARPLAEEEFVNTANLYATSLEMALEEALGEEAEALREKRIEVLTEAVAKTGQLIEELKSNPDRSQKDSFRLYDLMLKRGKMLTATARSQEDPTYSYSQAHQTLEELTYEAGEASPYGLQAFIGIGDNYREQGDPQNAAYTYEFVVDTVIPYEMDRWEQLQKDFELTEQDKIFRWRFVELAAPGLIQSYIDAGNTENALKWALYTYNTWKREGFALTPPGGSLALLGVSNALLESGGYVGGSLAAGEARWFASEEEMKDAVSGRRNQTTAIDLSLSIAQQINDENKGTALQVRAQKLLKRIIDRPGVTASVDTLFEAAKGEYAERNYGSAVTALKGVMSRLEAEDEATRERSGAEVFFYLGRSYQRSESYLLAASAFREGVLSFPGDETYNFQNAKNNLDAVRRFIARVGGEEDPALKSLEDEAEALVVKYPGESGGACSILFKNANDLQKDKDYEDAKAKYAEMEPSCDEYELARVFVALMDYRMDRLDEAKAAFADYLTNYVTDPTNAITDNEKRGAYRRAAKAQAQYYLGFIAYKRALTKGAEATEADWRAVIEQFRDYKRLYPNQERFVPASMQQLSRSYIKIGDLDQARSVYDEMMADENLAKTDNATNTGIALYKELGKLRKGTEDDEDLTVYKDLTRRMADLLKGGNESDSTPNFGNLRAESKHWMELEDYATAEGVLRKIYTRFKESEAEAIRVHVGPDLGHALLQQNKLAEAYEVLKPLASGDLKPGKRTLIDYTRAVLGWVEGTGANPVVVPGAVQDPEAAEDAYRKLLQVSKQAESWTAEWYPLNFDVMYALHVRSELDSKVKKDAKDVMDRFASNFLEDPQFSRIEEAMSEASPALKREYGDDVLRRRYLWLRRKIGG